MSYTGKAIDLSKYDKYGKNVELSKVEVQLSLVDDLNKYKNSFEKGAKQADKAALDALSALADSTNALESAVKTAEAVVKVSKDLGLEQGVKIGQDSLKQFNTTLSQHRKAIDAARELRNLVK
jgi:hypothetical protein